MTRQGEGFSSRHAAVFATTHWSVVLAAGNTESAQASAALGELCETYWYPLYAFVRRQGNSPADAQDLTQAFFARFLEKEYIGLADPTRGRFRSFLLACLKNFLLEQRRQASRLKRGGGQKFFTWDSQTAEQRYVAEPQEKETPETIYEKRWALTLLERALSRLSDELTSNGKERFFAELKSQIWGEKSGAPYSELAERLGISEAALKVGIHRLRKRYREILREEVAHTVGSHAEIDEELRHLITVVRG